MTSIETEQKNLVHIILKRALTEPTAEKLAELYLRKVEYSNIEKLEQKASCWHNTAYSGPCRTFRIFVAFV